MMVAMIARVHPAVVVATAAVCATVGTVYAPASAAMTPQLVSAGDLGSANALRNTIDEISVIVGPAIGGLLITFWAPWVAVLVNAATFAASAICLRMIKARSTPVDVTEGGEVGPLRQMLVGIQTIGSSSATSTLVAFSVIAFMGYGIDTVLFVVISDDILGTGAEGSGYLLAGLGVGGIAVAGLVSRLEQLPRLGFVILGGMILSCVPSLLFLVFDQPVIGFAAQCIRGAAKVVVDVLAVTARQRMVPPDRLARVFGAFDGLVLSAVLVGSLIVPIGLRWWGLDGMLWATGLAIPALCFLGLPWLLRMDRESAERRAMLHPRTVLLEGLDLFASVSEGALEQLAGEAEFIDVAAGTRVVTQGERADMFYVIAAGTFRASSVDEHGVPRVLQDMGKGDYFGEIGLIESIPRTATVTAETDGRLLQVNGAAFLAALTQYRPSAAFLDGASFRLSRTHSTSTLTQAGLAGEEA
jgi:predicted MFS family arabinose efflux permease